jgi:hypothetical protein
MNYIYDSFLSPLEQSDKTIKILDIDGILKYSINPISISNI